MITSPSHQHLGEKEGHDVMLALVASPRFVELYPNLQKMASVGLVVPTSTVDCERGFSAVKRIKTPLRNHLSHVILQILLFISIEGPPLAEFPFHLACDKWAAFRNRRVDVSK